MRIAPAHADVAAEHEAQTVDPPRAVATAQFQPRGGHHQERTGGNREDAAKGLGIGERTLYRKIKEYELG